MTCEDEALISLGLASDARKVMDRAKEQHTRYFLRYLRDARQAGWSWPRIGKAVGLSDVAVRRYWERNRQSAGRTGRSDNANTEVAQARVAAPTQQARGRAATTA